jgi:hypothetical protein
MVIFIGRFADRYMRKLFWTLMSPQQAASILAPSYERVEHKVCLRVANTFLNWGRIMYELAAYCQANAGKVADVTGIGAACIYRHLYPVIPTMLGIS